MFANLFEDMGFLYLGPIDGHNIAELTRIFRRAKELHVPVIVHCITQKGKGYAFSERNPEKYHGVAPFSIDTGDPVFSVTDGDQIVARFRGADSYRKALRFLDESY